MKSDFWSCTSSWTQNFQYKSVLMRKILKTIKNISICTLFFDIFREIQFFASHEPVNTEFSTKLGFDAQNLENDRKHKHMQTFFNQFSYFELARAREYRIFTKNLVFMRNILKTIQNISICTLFSINFHEIQLLSLHELVNTEWSPKIGFDAQNFENNLKHRHIHTFFDQFARNPIFDLARAGEHRIFN